MTTVRHKPAGDPRLQPPLPLVELPMFLSVAIKNSPFPTSCLRMQRRFHKGHFDNEVPDTFPTNSPTTQSYFWIYCKQSSGLKPAAFPQVSTTMSSTSSTTSGPWLYMRRAFQRTTTSRGFWTDYLSFSSELLLRSWVPRQLFATLSLLSQGLSRELVPRYGCTQPTSGIFALHIRQARHLGQVLHSLRFFCASPILLHLADQPLCTLKSEVVNHVLLPDLSKLVPVHL